MAAHSWTRNRYPLQTQSQNHEPTSSEVASFQAINDASTNHSIQDTQLNKAPAPWHHAVTGDRLERYSISSRAGSDTNRSYQVGEFSATDGSSTAVSRSHRSPSPLPINHDLRPTSGIAEENSPSRRQPAIDQTETSQASCPWSPGSDPPRSTGGMSTDERPPTPKPGDQTDGQSIETLRSDEEGHPQRTLRRTPRSRRINSPIPAEDLEEPTISGEALDESKAVASGSKPWKRKVYPVQAITSGSSTSLAQDSTNAGSKVSEKASIAQKTEQCTEVTSVAPATTVAKRAHSIQTPRSEADSSGGASWSRTVYPLQASTAGSTTASVAPLDSEAPASSHGDAYEPSESVSAEHIPTTRTRRAYPLQPATAGSTIDSTSQVSMETDERRSTEEHMADPAIGAQAEEAPTSRGRRAYPLQAPASNANLRASPTPPSSPESRPGRESKVSSDQSGKSGNAAIANKSVRRMKYPLQSPASHAALPQPPSPPQSPERGAANVEKPALGQSSMSQSSPATKLKRRQKYSLQAAASIANLKVPAISSPPDEESRSEDIASAKEAREKAIATRVVNQWRRQAYPLQSPKGGSFLQRPWTPQPREEEDTKKEEAKPVQLPMHIRAVKDATDPLPKGRTIVVCLDGTGDKFDNDNSNIVHLISALKKDDPNQISYYQAGIGTYGAGGLSGGVSAAMDMAVGSGLGLHVRDGYNFLMHTYKEGDRICIFGFSRGAYTARCLAGMIHKVGLLPSRNVEQVPFAYEFYANDTPQGWKQSEDFKKTFCIDVNVHFLGCFDSVASVGFIPRQLPLSTTPYNKPRYFRHAMALDERRAKFKICRHQTRTLEEIGEGAIGVKASGGGSHLHRKKNQNDMPPDYAATMDYGKSIHPNVTDEEYERLAGHEAPFDTDVLEVWFAGAHADVGGGAVPNDERHKLAQIPLRWMIRQAFECDTGIIFKTKILAEHGLDVHTLWPKYEKLRVPTHGPPPSYLEKYENGLPPRSVRQSKLIPSNKHENGERLYDLKSPTDDDWTPEQVEDFFDAMSPMNDQLLQAPSWWILEAWPVRYKVPTGNGEAIVRLGMNLGRYRGVEDREPNLHWTVQHRMQHLGYVIYARTAAHTTWKAVV